MAEPNLDKKIMTCKWLVEMIPGHTELVFVWKDGVLKITPEAQKWLAQEWNEGMFLYVLLLINDPMAAPIPIYVGKTNDPSKRWLRGHVAGLTTAITKPHGLYERWTRKMREWQGTYHLLMLHESDIQRAPIPGFPRTVGSVEYQLISLVDDGFPGMLLNREGVAR